MAKLTLTPELIGRARAWRDGLLATMARSPDAVREATARGCSLTLSEHEYSYGDPGTYATLLLRMADAVAVEPLRPCRVTMGIDGRPLRLPRASSLPPVPPPSPEVVNAIRAAKQARLDRNAEIRRRVYTDQHLPPKNAPPSTILRHRVGVKTPAQVAAEIQLERRSRKLHPQWWEYAD